MNSLKFDVEDSSALWSYYLFIADIGVMLQIYTTHYAAQNYVFVTHYN